MKMKLDKETMKLIGSNIRRERLMRKMSLEGLAEILQLSTAFLGLIERGQRGAKLANLMKIADVFGITVDDLLYRKSTNTPEIRPEWEGHERPIGLVEQQKKDAIVSLIYDFSVEEMDFAIGIIKNTRILRKNNKINCGT
jgi:transcriptional regulator with XRE-family HTH domain